MNCIKCKAEIAEKNINIHEDVVICDECGEKFRPSDTLKDYSKGPADLSNPPRGIKVTKTTGNLLVTVNIRSWTAIFWAFFSALLSAFFILFVATVEMTAMVAFHMICAAIPLIIIWAQTLLRTFGKLELKFNNHTGHLFIGVGRFGLKKNFHWWDINTIENKIFKRRKGLDMDSEFAPRTLVLRGMKNISFIVALDQDKRDYLKNLMIPFILKAKERL